MSPLSRLQQDVLSVAFVSIANLLLLLRPNQGLSDLCPHLNYFVHFLLQSSTSVYCSVHISVFFSLQFCSLSLYFYNFQPDVQILCNYNNSYFPNPHLQHMDYVKQILLSNQGILSLHLFSSLLPLEQVLPESTVEVLLVFLAISKAVAFVTQIPLVGFCLNLFSYHPLYLSSSFLLYLQFLFKVIILSYHCLIEPGYHLDFMSLWYIVALIPPLNSSTSSLLSYSLPLSALLNFCTNFSMVLFPCSNLFNSATFTDSSSPSPNFFLILAKNSPTISYSSNPPFKSSNVFSFHTFADPLYIYDNTY